MIISIYSGNAYEIDTHNKYYEINLYHKDKRKVIIREVLQQGDHVIIETFCHDIVYDILAIAEEMGMIDQVELYRYDRTSRPDGKLRETQTILNGILTTHYTGQGLYNAAIKFGFEVL